MKKLVIASSAKFQNEIGFWKKYFEEQGYNVLNYPQKINDKDLNEYKKVHIRFFQSLIQTDILFVLNEDKNGIEGYIGAETFAELSFAMVQNIVNNASKKIYLLKMPSEKVACYAEIKNFIALGWIEIFKKGE